MKRIGTGGIDAKTVKLDQTLVARGKHLHKLVAVDDKQTDLIDAQAPASAALELVDVQQHGFRDL